MQVHSVNNQYRCPNFGTKVTIDKATTRVIKSSGVAEQTINDAIKQLRSNGVSDSLYLSHCYDGNSKDPQIILRGWTTSIRNGKKYKTPINCDGRDFLADTHFNWDTAPEPRIADIMKIYISAKACEVAAN